MVRALFGLALVLVIALVILPKMKARQEIPAAANARPLVVKTVEIIPKKLEFTREYTARITDNGRTMLSARLITTVREVLVQEGDMVAAGDVLVHLDTQDVRAEVNRARAALAKVEADYGFIRHQIEIDRTLFEGGAISKTAFDESTRQLKGLQANIRQQKNSLILAKQKLGYATISAPISGRIQNVHVRKGEEVAPGKPVIEIIGLGDFKAVISVPERDLSQFKSGDIAYLEAPDGAPWTGTIDRIYPALDARTHTGTLEVQLAADQSQKFFAGSMTQVKLISASFEKALFVPAQAIFTRNGIHGVFVVEDGKAYWKTVLPGASDGYHTVIDGGLVSGDQVITTPYPSLHDGVNVLLSVGAKP
jgi:RND family efflux transporter MFP subunit